MNIIQHIGAICFGWIRPSMRPLSDWLVIYKEQLNLRGLKTKTLKDKYSILERVDSVLGDIPIGSIVPHDAAKFIHIYVLAGKNSAARNAYILLRDIFRTAQENRWITINPTEPLKSPKTPIKRVRLILPEWQRIYNAAQIFCPEYAHHAMLLAMITAQRRGDISAMRRDHIFDDHLHITQEKTGQKVALPLDLYSAELNLNLRTVIDMCPGKDYLLGNRRVSPWSLSFWFAHARDIAYSLDSWEGDPPSFHEQRSLSERLYRGQHVNTQRLLGHKSSTTTALYDCDRGREYLRLVL
ncbi:tyrosine-type recombinase/integrase [Photorhabdus bodei]|uniref:Tyrosine-type recombinase/integrase n=1 Tax=Photorhabdus bodei TaxID=2029681 RepID=A0AAW6BSG6_9GAMM|nr:tyrosine-type recombinase/integrase [Photorhabdus bodei]MDB6374664.1 tyrosine-type recombinase/integrase [Photorhabdus bodei]